MNRQHICTTEHIRPSGRKSSPKIFYFAFSSCVVPLTSIWEMQSNWETVTEWVTELWHSIPQKKSLSTWDTQLLRSYSFACVCSSCSHSISSSQEMTRNVCLPAYLDAASDILRACSFSCLVSKWLVLAYSPEKGRPQEAAHDVSIPPHCSPFLPQQPDVPQLGNLGNLWEISELYKLRKSNQNFDPLTKAYCTVFKAFWCCNQSWSQIPQRILETFFLPRWEYYRISSQCFWSSLKIQSLRFLLG